MSSVWDASDVFGLTESVLPGARVVAVSGELDLATSPRLDAALEAVEPAEADAVVLDLSDCTFMDSTGLRVVIQRDAALRDAGARLLVVVADGPVRRLLDLAARGLLDVQPTRDAALAALGVRDAD